MQTHEIITARACGTTIIFQHINDLAVFGVLINIRGGETKFEIHPEIFLAKLSKTFFFFF